MVATLRQMLSIFPRLVVALSLCLAPLASNAMAEVNAYLIAGEDVAMGDAGGEVQCPHADHHKDPNKSITSNDCCHFSFVGVTPILAEASSELVSVRVALPQNFARQIDRHTILRPPLA